jgi:hypothetical protein
MKFRSVLNGLSSVVGRERPSILGHQQESRRQACSFCDRQALVQLESVCICAHHFRQLALRVGGYQSLKNASASELCQRARNAFGVPVSLHRSPDWSPPLERYGERPAVALS